MPRRPLRPPTGPPTRVLMLGAIAVPTLLGVVSAGLLVGYQQQHAQLGADARARAAAAVAVAQVDFTLSQLSAAALTGTGAVSETVPAAAAGQRISASRAAEAR